jgi:hypothetical protein
LQADTANINTALSNNPTILAMSKDIEWIKVIAGIIVIIACAVFALILRISIKQASITYIEKEIADLKRNIERNSGQLRQ